VELSFEVLLNRGVMKDRSILWGIILQQVFYISMKNKSKKRRNEHQNKIGIQTD
jgi:hypothetical protein